MGDRGFLVELPGNREVHLLAAAVRDHFGARIEDVVPGAETLLLAWADRPPSAAELTAELGGLDLTAPDEPDADPVTIPVRYDGPDLELAFARMETLGRLYHDPRPSDHSRISLSSPASRLRREIVDRQGGLELLFRPDRGDLLETTMRRGASELTGASSGSIVIRICLAVS